jgi:glutathione S-transferase
MILTGQLDSPFVRRVAIALYTYGLPFEHSEISAYGDFAELLALNPLGKAPALTLDEGTVLADSTMILDYLDRSVVESRSLWPQSLANRARALAHTGVAMGLAEKAVEFRTETVRRPPEKIDQPRVDRVRAQIAASLRWLETNTPEDGLVFGDDLTHADIASTVATTFIANKNAEHLAAQVSETQEGFPKLLAHTARCEQLKAFIAAPFKNY